MVRAVRRRDVAQDAGRRPDPVQVVGTGLVDVGPGLQQYAERTLRAGGFLRERSRPTVSGNTMPGKSTTLRTGTMMSASAGSGRAAPSAGALFAGAASARTPLSALTGGSLLRFGSFIGSPSRSCAASE
jgi:hypothetical protein